MTAKTRRCWRIVRRSCGDSDCVETISAIRFDAGPKKGEFAVQIMAGDCDDGGDFVGLYDLDGELIWVAGCSWSLARDAKLDIDAWRMDGYSVEARP